MQVETVMNGGISLVLIPQNEMEEALLKEITKQDNEIIDIRNGTTILDKNIANGLMIRKKNAQEVPATAEHDLDVVPENPTPSVEENEEEAKDL